MANRLGISKLAVSFGLGCALLGSATQAQAIEQAPPYPGSVYSGTSTLHVSADALAFMDEVHAQFGGYETGTVSVLRDEDGFYANVEASAPVASVTLDLADMAMKAVHAIGGMTISTPQQKYVSSGGALTITDLTLDLALNEITGTVTGLNGVGTLKTLPIWRAEKTYSSIHTCQDIGDYHTTAFPVNEYVLETVTANLSLTKVGQQAFIRALGLFDAGERSFIGSRAFGVLRTSTHLYATDNVHVVPEPATWALMGLGLTGVIGLQHRSKRAQTSVGGKT